MNQWLDSLSEDWVSQPRSPHSSPPAVSSASRDSPSPVSNGSQSRIPRFKPRSISGLSVASAVDSRPVPSLWRSSEQGALREKTSSNINASQKCLPTGKVKTGGLDGASMSLRGRQASTGCILPAQQDTVQHKSSPIKTTDTQGTPEWKRRMLKENLGKGDLFSPSGLEGIFKPLTVNAKVVGKKNLFPVGKTPLRALPLPEENDAEKAMKSAPPRREPAERRKSAAYTAATYNNESPSSMRSPAGSVVADTTNTKPNQTAHQSLALPKQNIRSESANDLTETEVPSAGAVYTEAGDKTRNENISPLYVSRHNTVDGRVEFAAIDMSVRRLRSEMEKVRMQQQDLPSSRSSDHGVDYTDSRIGESSMQHDWMDEATSQSLPEDLSMGTDAFAANGGFISIHRGGYSNNGSFQRRPVSPSLLPDLDGPSLKSPSSIHHKGRISRETSESFAQTKSKTPSSPPETPHRDNQDQPSSYERPKSSGSPLKLFDKYDTFTNERLVRRLSKFEATLNQEIAEELDLGSDDFLSTPSPGPKMHRRRSQREYSADNGEGRRISSFGDGNLDTHSFAAHEPLASASSPEPVRMDQDHEFEKNEHDPDAFRFERSLTSEMNSSQSRRSHMHKPQRGANPHHPPSTRDYDQRPPGKRMRDKIESNPGHDLREPIQIVHGKQLPYSPFKDPAPKRRRTLREADGVDRQEMHNAPVQSLLGRKRKDARYDTNHEEADPSIIARRQMLRPKAPTLNRGNSVGRQHDIENPVHQQLSTEGERLEGNHNEFATVDPPTRIVAGALATVALNTVQEITGGSRKASVTTADFFNEAQHIMQLLRAKGRPRSSHTTAETSAIDHPTIMEESVVEDSTKDEFSRPPSRDGEDLPKLGVPAHTNPRVVSHLLKYEDKEDLGLALSSSLKNLQISQTNVELVHEIPHKEDEDNHHCGTESDPPNIRIREGAIHAHRQNRSSSKSNTSSLDSQRQHRPHGSQSTSNASTSRSNPTGSSHGSSNRMVIAPETIAHLLADEMAGMAYDHQRQVWVRRKSTPKIGGMHNADHSASEGTEEDFFRDIPDLSVDEMEELQRVKDAVSSVRSVASTKDKASARDLAVSAEMQVEVHGSHEPMVDVRPKTADGKAIDPVENSSAPSKYSHFAFSGPAPGTSTRATSWGDDDLPPKEPQLPVLPRLAVPKISSEDHECDVEHEISILEGRLSPTPNHQKQYRQARVVTVAFSSPLADHREFRDELDEGYDTREEDSKLDLTETPARKGTQRNQFSNKRTSFGPSRPGARSTSRRQSLGNHSYVARPMSRLDEQEELSLVHCSISKQHMSMDVAISTPMPTSRSIIVAPNTAQRSSVGFFLSPLPDFTVNQVDRPIDSNPNQAIRRRSDSRKPAADNQLSLTAQHMVKTLTDVQPYEPYWEYIRSVDLHDRNLRTLHMLDEFCGRVEELDVSNNQICELNGIPGSVRLLNVRGNCLSDLAAWQSLKHLQYLDVSENELSSLKGFSGLFHLRALKADENEIESLDGVGNLDGLISLSLRGNKLRAVDFEGYNLTRLAQINLSRNKLIEVSNLHQLTTLEACDLSNNDLDSLDFSMSDPLYRLQSLTVSSNNLTFIDLAELPNLKTLNLDKNSIGSIESLDTLKHLENLSWREQELIGFSEIQYQHCQELRSLYLSGNHLSKFAPSTPFLNLHHLELASTGLKTLSSDFGPRCPNLRTLNINYNAISDLRPLLGIVKLEKLYAAGNRISKLRRTVSVLQRLCEELKEVDLRNNPLTVGYYTPSESYADEKRLALQTHDHRLDGGEEDLETKTASAYLLQSVDKDGDNASRERLDEDTKIRRRVYEMMVVYTCKRLQRLDGLEVSRKMVGRRDGVWERLVELGVLNSKGEMDAGECMK